MAQKKIKLGTLLVNEIVDKNTNKPKKLLSIGLGQKGKNEQYNLSVEVTVRDSKGKVVAQQTDGYLELVDPRKEPDDLLAAGFIDEDMAEKMKLGLEKLSDKVKYVVKMRAS